MWLEQGICMDDCQQRASGTSVEAAVPVRLLNTCHVVINMLQKQIVRPGRPMPSMRRPLARGRSLQRFT